jgi:hypothetical protein
VAVAARGRHLAATIRKAHAGEKSGQPSISQQPAPSHRDT